jgi:hypothetical protein
MNEASQNQAKQTSAIPEQLIAGSIGAPASGPARHCSLHHRAVPEAGVPIHAFAINCRST